MYYSIFINHQQWMQTIIIITTLSPRIPFNIMIIIIMNLNRVWVLGVLCILNYALHVRSLLYLWSANVCLSNGTGIFVHIWNLANVMLIETISHWNQILFTVALRWDSHSYAFLFRDQDKGWFNTAIFLLLFTFALTTYNKRPP